MSIGSLTLILVSVTLSAIAQVAFKLGLSSDPGQGARAVLGPLAELLTPGVFVGLGLYCVGTLLWLTALGRVELSQAYPFVGVGFALTNSCWLVVVSGYNFRPAADRDWGHRLWNHPCRPKLIESVLSDAQTIALEHLRTASREPTSI